MSGTKLYKLTDQQNQTGAIVWMPGEWHSASGIGELCSHAFLHAYPSALAAMFLNPIHANIQLPKLWLAEGMGVSRIDPGLKVGYSQLRVVQELIPPTISQEDRIRAALHCSLQVCNNNAWISYADNYLNGTSMKFVTRGSVNEPEAEQLIRTYAWKAAMYEHVEFNSALAIQTAIQYKPFDLESIFAMINSYVDTPARGRSVEGQAFRSSP